MKKLILTVILVSCAGGSSLAGVELECATDFPQVGKNETVTLGNLESADDLSLWVVYSPNSETQAEEEIGRFSTGGTITWNPSRFGIATLSARDVAGKVIAFENVAILFATTPAAGVLVTILAGLLLFGGAGWSLRSVLRSGVPERPRRIDT